MYETGIDAAGHDGGHSRQATTIRSTTLCELATQEAGLVVPANYNTDEQTVVSGEIAGVERAMELAKEAGAKRAIKLPVSGAFHSPLMEPAVVGLTDAIATSAFTEPAFPVFSNVTADASTTAADAKELLLRAAHFAGSLGDRDHETSPGIFRMRSSSRWGRATF